MLQVLRVTWRALRFIWEEMFHLLPMNLLTLLCVLLVIPAAPAWMALHAVCHRIAREYAVSWSLYVDAFRRYFGRAWVFGLAWLGVLVLLLINAWWYGEMFPDEWWTPWVRGAWLGAIILWLMGTVYAIPFYLEQSDQRWRLALRNSMLTFAASPLFTASLVLIGAALIAVMLIFTPLFLALGPAVWAMLVNTALADRLDRWAKSRGAAATADEP